MANQKILVIDDSGVIRRTVKEMLPTGKVEVLEAKDGIEGLNLIRHQHPNLIMLDFILPKMSGWELFQQIQEQRSREKIPLVVMSGSKKEVTQKISEPFRDFAFIEKPFDKKALMASIKEAMAKLEFIEPIEEEIDEDNDFATADGAEESIELLNKQIAKMQAEIEKIPIMQAEIDLLKKQLAQVLVFIKQKLK